MTTKLFQRAAYGLIGLSLAFVFIGGQMTGSSAPATNTPTALPAPSPAPTLKPTKGRYNCGEASAPEYITLNWTRPMPKNGWLGEVTFGNITSKPIQVFDAKSVAGGTSWAFQAQDGTFLCRMFVSSNPLQRNISFGECRNNIWPQLDCSLRGMSDTSPDTQP